MVSAAVRQLRPDQAMEAAGYIRVSSERQGEGYSPELQRGAIKQLARQEGYVLADDLIEEDHERGSKVTRKGYQRIIEAVRQGRVHIVIVYMFDRFGRDGAEWLARVREFERLGVEVISVREGRDEGGLMRFVRAGMAEEYSRQLAKRVQPARERAAQGGTHMGVTPLGYKRVYPPREAGSRPPAGLLVEDEATAWVVQELFTRYAAGGWSFRTLVGWMNSDDRVPKPVGREGWTQSSIQYMLKNPVYIGMVRYNKHHTGYYERAAEGSMFIVPGKHEPLIDRELFDAVQRRMAAAVTRHSYNRHDDDPVLAVGLLTCNVCGAPMCMNRLAAGSIYYKCARHKRGLQCAPFSYNARVAHDALLREVARLKGAPWTPQAEKQLTGGQRTDVARAATIDRQLTEWRNRLRKQTLLMTAMEDDPTPEQIAVFRQVSAEISATIAALETERAALGKQVAHVPNLRKLHARLTHTEIGHVLATLGAQGDVEGQRAMLQEIIASASIVERVPQTQAKWMRVAVIWTQDVQTLLDAGLVRLDDAPEAPRMPTRKEKKQEYNRGYRERRRKRAGIST